MAQTLANRPPAGAAPTASQQDIHGTAARPEPVVEWPDEGQELPDQMGGQRTTLLPGISTFRLPENLTTLWHDVEMKDTRPFLPNGQKNPTEGQTFKRKVLRFDRNAPLIVVGGPHDGEPMTATFSTNPRPRGKKDNPQTAWISDAAYLLDVALGDKSRPADPKVLVAKINAHGGQTIRLEHGLTAQCRPDKPRYLRVALAEGQYQDIPDPSGQKGCGTRYYTKQFKNAESGGYDLEIMCGTCSTPDPTPAELAQGVQPTVVVLRAFENVERILAPLGTK